MPTSRSRSRQTLDVADRPNSGEFGYEIGNRPNSGEFGYEIANHPNSGEFGYDWIYR